MRAADIQDHLLEEPSSEDILAQLERMTQDEVFRSSKRSVAFLKYVVGEALRGSGDQIKERTIGVEVFGRSASYDTNVDHIVRTAASELRKRLAIYYGDEKHRGELRIGLLPGSYLPKFGIPHEVTERSIALPIHPSPPDEEHSRTTTISQQKKRRLPLSVLALTMVVLTAAAGYRWLRPPSADSLFWQQVVNTPGPVLLAVGDVPNGPPRLPDDQTNPSLSTPVPSAGPAQTLPLADAMTAARVVAVLEGRHKQVLIRRDSAISFSDLRERAVVLVGAFNNEWSLRLTHSLRYSLALDPAQHVVYIRDAKNPSSRSWSWSTNQPRDPASGINSPRLQDYALISRIQPSETGHAVVVVGGLYTYGTEAAGEFLADPDLMEAVAHQIGRMNARGTLQIVLATTVTDGTPGPPRVVAVSTE
jgi:hypothetical protein